MKFTQPMLVAMLIVAPTGLLAVSDPNECSADDVKECVQPGTPEKSTKEICDDAKDAHLCLLELKSDCSKPVWDTINTYSNTSEEQINKYCKGRTAEFKCSPHTISNCIKPSVSGDFDKLSFEKGCKDSIAAVQCLTLIKPNCNQENLEMLNNYKNRKTQHLNFYCLRKQKEAKPAKEE